MGIGIELPSGHASYGLPVLVGLEILAEPFQAAVDALLSVRGAFAPLGDAAHQFRRQRRRGPLCLAGQKDPPDGRSRPRRDRELDVLLLVFGVRLGFAFDAGEKQAVVSEKLAHLLLGERNVLFEIAVAQTELRGVRQTDGARRGGRALHGDQPDEPARAGLENHLDAAFDLLALRLDIFVAAGGPKLVDAFGYRAGVERLTRANGDNLSQVILGQRLATWYELDLDHGRPGSGTARRGTGRRSTSTGREEHRQQENPYQYQNYRTCPFRPWLWTDVSSITVPSALGRKLPRHSLPDPASIESTIRKRQP